VKTGSNAWWIGIQILNHRTPVVKLEALYNGAWVTTPRMNYNYFVYASGLGPGPFTLRVTDFYGRQLVDANIPLSPDVKTSGQANFSSYAGVETQTYRAAIPSRARELVVVKAGSARSLQGIQSGVYDIYTAKGCFVGRINSAGGIKMLEFEKAAKNGIIIIKPVSVIR
jgi:hypothetical protein